MPQLMQNDDMQIMPIPGQGGFQFSAVRPEKLGATEYTLVTVVIDESGSVAPFKDGLLKALRTIVDACRKNPRASNLMLRVLAFNDQIREIHGFMQLGDVDQTGYQEFWPGGTTALYDASFSGIGATVEYAKVLSSQDFDVNAAVYIITDGMNNRGQIQRKEIAALVDKAKRSEDLDSIVTVLIGLHDDKLTGKSEAIQVAEWLEKFRSEAGFTQFVDAGEATAQKLAKLANWVSRSISSQSQSLGSGMASQPLTF